MILESIKLKNNFSSDLTEKLFEILFKSIVNCNVFQISELMPLFATGYDELIIRYLKIIRIKSGNKISEKVQEFSLNLFKNNENLKPEIIFEIIHFLIDKKNLNYKTICEILKIILKYKESNPKLYEKFAFSRKFILFIDFYINELQIKNEFDEILKSFFILYVSIFLFFFLIFVLGSKFFRK